MKKLFALLISLLCVISCFSLVGCMPRSELLKIYAPGEYIDPDVADDFTEWYNEKTGLNCKVVVTPFDTVEQIFTSVSAGDDFDLYLPSDYAVERLIRENALIEIDKTKVDISKEGLIRPEFLERAKISDKELKYSVPYMYGTFGIMYDTSVIKEKITSWDAIFTGKYGNNLSSNKDSLREAIFSAAIYANKDALKAASADYTDYSKSEYQTLLNNIYSDFSSAAIGKAMNVLEEMKKFHNNTWGGEDLKYNMATGKSDIKIALMWSCDAGYIMNDYEDDNGVEHPGNKNMWYVIPDEGGNIYLDNFVISKNAKNVDAAQYFLQYICEKETAIANSEYAGAISVVKAAYDELKEEYESDDSLGEGTANPAEWREMYLDMLFPSEQTLLRCGTMIDFKDADSDISREWVEIKK